MERGHAGESKVQEVTRSHKGRGRERMVREEQAEVEEGNSVCPLRHHCSVPAAFFSTFPHTHPPTHPLFSPFRRSGGDRPTRPQFSSSSSSFPASVVTIHLSPFPRSLQWPSPYTIITFSVDTAAHPPLPMIHDPSRPTPLLPPMPRPPPVASVKKGARISVPFLLGVLYRSEM